MYWDRNRRSSWQSIAGGFALMWTDNKLYIPEKA